MPLSPRGIWQANRLADRAANERVAGDRIDAVIASDLARAWLTGATLAHALQLQPVADARLRERHFGRFQGCTLDEIADRWPGDLARWRARDPAWPIPDGEAGDAFITRVLAALAELAAQWAGRTIAVVAHGGTLDVAYRHARGLPWDAPREHVMLNAAINRVRAQAAPALRLEIEHWGDAAHLAAPRDELAAQ